MGEGDTMGFHGLFVGLQCFVYLLPLQVVGSNYTWVSVQYATQSVAGLSVLIACHWVLLASVELLKWDLLGEERGLVGAMLDQE